MNRAQAIGLAMMAFSALGLRVDARVFFCAWLAAWWWCLGLVLGTFVNAWMHRLTGGAWGEAIRPVALQLARRGPLLLLLLFAPVLAGLRWLYPWASAWSPDVARPAFLAAWLSVPFFLTRLLLYALAWWRLARAASLAGKGRAAASLLVHGVVSSLAGVDLVMSLMPGWASTAFGLVVLSNQALGGAALSVLLATRFMPHRWSSGSVPATPVWRDLGNLLLMWSMSWAYLAFMQFLIIWAENLPHEIAWFVPRLQTGWRGVALALVALQLVLPFVALLFRAVKDRPARLAAVAALLLAASALETAWTVLPSVEPHSLHGWWLLPLVFGGMALLLLGGLPATLAAARSGGASTRSAHAGA